MQVDWFCLGTGLYSDHFCEAVHQAISDDMLDLDLYLYRIDFYRQQSDRVAPPINTVHAFSKVKDAHGNASGVAPMDWVSSVSFIDYFCRTVSDAIEYVQNQAVLKHNAKAMNDMEPLPFEPKPFRRSVKF